MKKLRIQHRTFGFRVYDNRELKLKKFRKVLDFLSKGSKKIEYGGGQNKNST